MKRLTFWAQLYALLTCALLNAQEVEFDLMEFDPPFSVVDIFFVVILALIWVGFWRLLKRFIYLKLIAYWLPTFMLGMLALLGWSSSFVRFPEPQHWFLEPAAGVVATILLVVNLPALIPAWLVSVIGGEFYPRLTFLVASLVFWLTWFAVLRWLIQRPQSQKPLSLGIREIDSPRGA